MSKTGGLLATAIGETVLWQMCQRAEGVTHQSLTPPSRSTWILETLTLQIRRINTIFTIFRVFSIIWKVFRILQRL